MMRGMVAMIAMSVLSVGISLYSGVEFFRIFSTMMLTNIVLNVNEKRRE